MTLVYRYRIYAELEGYESDVECHRSVLFINHQTLALYRFAVWFVYQYGTAVCYLHFRVYALDCLS